MTDWSGPVYWIDPKMGVAGYPRSSTAYAHPDPQGCSSNLGITRAVISWSCCLIGSSNTEFRLIWPVA